MEIKRWLGFCGAALAALFLSFPAQANQSFITHDGYLVYDSTLTTTGVTAGNGTGNSVSGSIPYFRTDVDAYITAQAIVTSDTINSQTFKDGTQSTGSFTVASFAALSTATATASLTISSDSALSGACISGGGPGFGSFNVCNPANFAITGTASVDCPVIAAAINTFSIVLATCPAASGNIIYTSATYAASAWNSFTIASSSYTALQPSNLLSSNTLTSVGVGHLTGGQDNATLSINGITLTANKDFFPLTSNGVTAIAISSAIINNAALAAIVTSTTTGAGTVVYTTSTVTGTSTTYALFTSSNGALTLSTPVKLDAAGNTATGNLVGGTNSNYSITTGVINIANHGFNTGLAVNYSTSSGVGITGLNYGTTYYAVYIDANDIRLATGTAAVLSNTFVTLASSSSQTTAHSFILAPLVNTGIPSFQWVVSNDAAIWVPFTTTLNNITISSATIPTYIATGTVNTVDLGHMDYGYLGMNIIPPTAGAINMKVKVIGKSQ